MKINLKTTLQHQQQQHKHPKTLTTLHYTIIIEYLNVHDSSDSQHSKNIYLCKVTLYSVKITHHHNKYETSLYESEPLPLTKHACSFAQYKSYPSQACFISSSTF